MSKKLQLTENQRDSIFKALSIAYETYNDAMMKKERNQLNKATSKLHDILNSSDAILNQMNEMRKEINALNKLIKVHNKIEEREKNSQQ